MKKLFRIIFLMVCAALMSGNLLAEAPPPDRPPAGGDAAGGDQEAPSANGCSPSCVAGETVCLNGSCHPAGSFLCGSEVCKEEEYCTTSSKNQKTCTKTPSY